MSRCEHNDFNDYFEKCFDCGATRVDVLAENFRDELQAVYGKMLKDLDISSGDIDPLTQDSMDKAEKTLAVIVAKWLDNRYESEV